MEQRTVLVIDESLLVFDVLAALLSPHGYTVLREKNAADGLSRARRERPALIIADIPLFVMDAFEVIRAAQADKEIGATPMIIWSAGYAGDQVSRRLGDEISNVVALDKFCNRDLLVATVKKLAGTASKASESSAA